jgi:hypothetical protein
MWASVVVKADPVADSAYRVLVAVEALAMDACLSVDFHAELMGWIPPPDGIAMCQGDVG